MRGYIVVTVATNYPAITSEYLGIRKAEHRVIERAAQLSPGPTQAASRVG
jgi:ATP phosphoribosyltransferase